MSISRLKPDCWVLFLPAPMMVVTATKVVVMTAAKVMVVTATKVMVMTAAKVMMMTMMAMPNVKI